MTGVCSSCGFVLYVQIASVCFVFKGMLLLLFWYLRLPVLVLSINTIRFSRETIWWLILPSVTSLAEEAWQIC